MIVRFFATLRNISGTREIEVPAPGNIQDLLLGLSKAYGITFDREIWLERDGTHEKLVPGVIILVNGRHYAHLEGLTTKLKDTDVISLFPPVAGG